MLGGWNYQPNLTTYDTYIFYNAVGKHPNYFFSPVAVAKQIVNGTNYRFICIARPIDLEEPAFFAIVSIYQPIDGRPYVTDITPIET